MLNASMLRNIKVGGSRLDEDKNYKYCEITVKEQNHFKICGKVDIKPKLYDPRSKVFEKKSPLYFHGLVVELHCTLTLPNLNKQSEAGFEAIPKTELLANNSVSGGIYKSQIYTLISGTEEGMQRGPPKQAATHFLDDNPTFYPFSIEIPSHQILGGSLVCKYGKVCYYLVALIRTKNGYEELDRKCIRFPGHRVINELDTGIKMEGEVTEGNYAICLTCPSKYYLPKDAVNFSLDVQRADQPNTDGCTLTIIETIQIIRRITTVTDGEGKVEDEVVDSLKFKKVSAKLNELVNTSGKLKLDEKFQLKKMLGFSGSEDVNGIIPTFTSCGMMKVQYFLECHLLFDVTPGGGGGGESLKKDANSLKYHKEVEIVVGSCRKAADVDVEAMDGGSCG